MLSKQNIIIASLGGIVLTLCVLLAGSVHEHGVPNAIKDIVATKYSEKFVNFPASTKAKIEYVANKSVSSQNLEIKKIGKHFIKTTNLEKSNDTYLAFYSIRNANNKTNIDINLTIDKTKDEVIAELSGLPIDSTVGLHIGQTEHVHNIPTDWAGRITVNATTAAEIDNKNICLNLRGLIKDKTSIVCHHIDGSNVGQVTS